MKIVHIQQIPSVEKGLHLKANKFKQNNKKLWMRHDKVGEGEIVATFYDLHSEIWSASPAA